MKLLRTLVLVLGKIGSSLFCKISRDECTVDDIKDNDYELVAVERDRIRVIVLVPDEKGIIRRKLLIEEVFDFYSEVEFDTIDRAMEFMTNERKRYDRWIKSIGSDKYPVTI